MSWKRVKKRLKRFLKYEEDWFEEGDQPITPEAANVAQQIIDGDVSLFARREGGLEIRFLGTISFLIEPDGTVRVFQGGKDEVREWLGNILDLYDVDCVFPTHDNVARTYKLVQKYGSKEAVREKGWDIYNDW